MFFIFWNVSFSCLQPCKSEKCLQTVVRIQKRWNKFLVLHHDGKNLSFSSSWQSCWRQRALMKLTHPSVEKRPHEASGTVHERERDQEWSSWKHLLPVPLCVCQGEDWPGLGEPWKDNCGGSTAGWCRWTSTDLRNASTGWRTASVWSRCAGGCPSDHRTCPFCRSAPAHTNNHIN